MNKILSLLVFCAVFAACDTTPANERDDYNTSDESEHYDEDVREEISAEALEEVEGDLVLSAELAGFSDEDMTGKVMIFSPQKSGVKMTALLDGLDPETYLVYISNLSSCNDLENVDLDLDDPDSRLAEVEVIVDGSGKEERILYDAETLDAYSGKTVLIIGPMGEVAGCGVLK